jgi:hypothetical protein
MSITHIRHIPSRTDSVQTRIACFLLKTLTHRPEHGLDVWEIVVRLQTRSRDSFLQFDLLTESIMKSSLVAYDGVLIGNLLQTFRWSFLHLQGSKEEVSVYPEYGGIKFLIKSVTNLQSAMRHTSQECNLQEVLSSQKRPDRLRCPPSLLLNWDRGIIAPRRAAGG